MTWKRAAFLALFMALGGAVMAAPDAGNANPATAPTAAQVVRADGSKSLWLVAGGRALQNLFLNLPARYPYFYQADGLMTDADLERCGTIILTSGGAFKGITPERMRVWVEQGGSLVLAGDLPAAFVKEWQEFLGPKARMADEAATEMEPVSHPLLFDEQGKPLLDWKKMSIRFAMSGLSGGTALLSKGGRTAIWLKPLGKGQVIYLSADLFPPFPMKMDHWIAATKTHDMFLANLMKFLKVPTMLDAAAAVKAPVAWHREPALTAWWIEGARTMNPPYPASPEEALSSVKMLAGRNEHERRMFFTTVPFAPEGIRVSLSALRGPAGEIPAVQVKIGYQGKPEPAYRGPLCFIRWLGKGEAADDPSPVTTWWVDVFTGEAAPGTYVGEMAFDFGKAEIKLPLEVEVNAARIPTRRPFHFSAEFFVYHIGVNYGWNESWPAHWEEMGIDFFVGSQVGYEGVDLRLRANGEKLLELAKKAPAPLKDQIPPLDFSKSNIGRWDLVLQNALQHQMTIYRVNIFAGAGRRQFLELAKALYRDNSLTEDSPETTATIIAVMREYGRFIREKGYRLYYSKSMDEWGAIYLKDYLGYAVPLHKAGWGNIANPDVLSVLSNRINRDEVWPYADLYWIEGRPEFWYDLKQIETFPPNEKGMMRGLMSLYTGSYWWSRMYLDGPRKAWATAYRRYPAFHLHGWSLRGKYSEENVYYLKNYAQVCPAMNLVMIAEGMDDVQYAFVLQAMLDDLERNAATQPAAKELREKWLALVSESPNAALPVVLEEVTRPNLTRQDFLQARRTLFDLLAQAREQARKLNAQPSLHWGSFEIVTAGKPATAVLFDGSSRAAAEAFVARIKAETGVALPMEPLSANPPDWAPLKKRIIFANNRVASFDAISLSLGGGVNKRYPADGAYVTYEDANGNVWIVGGSTDMQTLGGSNLLRAAELLPIWWAPNL